MESKKGENLMLKQLLINLELNFLILQRGHNSMYFRLLLLFGREARFVNYLMVYWNFCGPLDEQLIYYDFTNY